MESLHNRPHVYNDSIDALEKLEKEGKALIIRPEKIQGIGRTESDPHILDSLYLQGKEIGNKRLNEILEFVGKTVK